MPSVSAATSFFFLPVIAIPVIALPVIGAVILTGIDS
jgi:hypothetical protein